MNFFEQSERRFTSEQPYLEQSQSWREGMRYRYCPELYNLTQDQFERMSRCGQLMGIFLNQKVNPSILEFRIDYVCGQDDTLWVTEVQTDDRGLPAVAIERNARGIELGQPFLRVAETFLKSLQLYTQVPDPLLLITYPKKEKFYYHGFYDFAKICFAQQSGPHIIVTERENITIDNQQLRIPIPQEGLNLVLNPDLVWNFEEPIPGFKQIQPKITKAMLTSIWSSVNDNPLAQELKQYVPEVIPPNSPQLSSQKDSWILKPIDGRWSRGIIIGKRVDGKDWNQSLQSNSLIAQRFIQPRSDLLDVRTKNGDFALARMYSRIEGYYCRIESGWELADILVTATPDYPVHGRRDCIMTVAQVI